VVDHRSTVAILTRIARSSTLAAGRSPSLSKAAGVSSATWDRGPDTADANRFGSHHFKSRER